MYGFIVIAIFSWEKNTSAGALLFHFELAGTGGGGGGATKKCGRPIGLSLMLKMQGATMHGGTRGSSLEERRFNVAASPRNPTAKWTLSVLLIRDRRLRHQLVQVLLVASSSATAAPTLVRLHPLPH
nr:hypothetical protein Iba_chr11bCG15000 [Ipomoea batatas]